jgi:hypothetical protein
MTTPTDVKPTSAPATPPAQPPQSATPPAAPAPSTPPPAAAPAAPPKPLLAVDDTPAQPPQSQAPESYKFTAPQGQNYDPVTLSAYEVIARDLGLSQDNAQKMLDRIAPAVQAKLDAAAVARLETQSQEVVTHFGAGLDAALKDAKLTLQQLGNDQLRALMRDPRAGVGSSVGMVEFLAGIARRFLRSDQLHTEDRRGTPPAAPAVDDELAERYPKMTARIRAGR